MATFLQHLQVIENTTKRVASANANEADLQLKDSSTSAWVKPRPFYAVNPDFAAFLAGGNLQNYTPPISEPQIHVNCIESLVIAALQAHDEHSKLPTHDICLLRNALREICFRFQNNPNVVDWHCWADSFRIAAPSQGQNAGSFGRNGLQENQVNAYIDSLCDQKAQLFPSGTVIMVWITKPGTVTNGIVHCGAISTISGSNLIGHALIKECSQYTNRLTGEKANGFTETPLHQFLGLAMRNAFKKPAKGGVQSTISVQFYDFGHERAARICDGMHNKKKGEFNQIYAGEEQWKVFARNTESTFKRWLREDQSKRLAAAQAEGLNNFPGALRVPRSTMNFEDKKKQIFQYQARFKDWAARYAKK